MVLSAYSVYCKNVVYPSFLKLMGLDSLNIMAMPRISVVVVHVRLGRVSKDKHIIKEVLSVLADITGQLPIVTHARKSIANFKIRKGQVIGAKVTLRNEKMFSFIQLLRDVVLPRVRDFRGLNSKGDGRGNYTFRISPHDVFPGVDLNKVGHVFAVDITFVIKNSDSDAVMEKLLCSYGFPFLKR